MLLIESKQVLHDEPLRLPPVEEQLPRSDSGEPKTEEGGNITKAKRRAASAVGIRSSSGTANFI